MKLVSKTLLISALAIGLNSTAKAENDCVLPNAPIIPDGNVASKDELESARDAFKEFDLYIIDYRECLADKEKGLSLDSPTLEADKAKLLELDNISVDYLTKSAEKLNASLRTFNAR